MSIKIGGANLIKRYINGQSIKKVMYNGQQIWGEGIIPPPVDYHIIGDFQGGMPSGWVSTGGTISGGGLRNGGARWNQMPDLTNAIRIKIVYNIDVDGDSELSGEIKRGDNTYYGTTMGNDGGLTQNLHSLFFPYENTSETFTSFPAGTYIITADMDLLALTAIQELECPPLGHVENSEISITQEDVNLIRTGKVFDIFANASTVVHKIDFYVWYGHSEQQWIPEGYAMPTASAYEELTNKLNELNVPQRDWYKVLHMPLVGFGDYDSTERYDFGSSTYMWTPSPYGSSATSWHITTGGASMFRSDGRGYGQPVRAFKDEYIAPDNTWTVEWGSLGGAGIFWNQRLGLISITDGNDFNLTMSDKNLGATIAWSYGDTMTDANCGLYYQWGNCYGFSFTGGFTTDTECVDTTGYGYGNYYSRGVYVLRSGDWSCSLNDGLWDPNPYVPVTGLIFQEAGQTITLQPGQTYQLHASVTPSNASNQRILYSQGAGALYFSISPTGLISIPSDSTGGSTTIDVNTTEGGFSSSCNLVIDASQVPVTGVHIDTQGVNEIVRGGTIMAEIDVIPTNAAINVPPSYGIDFSESTPGLSFTYSYSTASGNRFWIVTANENLTVGSTVTIVARSEEGNFRSAYDLTVTEYVPVTGFTLWEHGIETTGEYGPLHRSIRPSNATNTTTVSSCLYPNVILNGDYIDCHNVPVGDSFPVWLQPEDNPGMALNCTVTRISGTPVSGITFADAGHTIMLGRGDTYQLQSTVYPNDAANQKVDYYIIDTETNWIEASTQGMSSNNMSVSSSGLITINNFALLRDYYIIAKTNDGYGCQSSCSLSIVPQYTVTWKNHDGTVLETDQVLRGETPVYNGSTPDYYNGEPSIEDYVFNGWSPTPGPIYSDTTYWATYRSLNGDGPDIEPI